MRLADAVEGDTAAWTHSCWDLGADGYPYEVAPEKTLRSFRAPLRLLPNRTNSDNRHNKHGEQITLFLELNRGRQAAGRHGLLIQSHRPVTSNRLSCDKLPN